MRNIRAALIVLPHTFGVSTRDGTTFYKHVADAIAFCLQNNFLQLDVIMSSDDQVYERIPLPDLKFIDRQIYAWRKEKQLAEEGIFVKKASSDFLIFAGIAKSDAQEELFSQLNTAKIKILSVRLFALESSRFLPKDANAAHWHVVIAQSDSLLHISVFKGCQFIFYRNTSLEELPLTLDYVRHHPEYYEEDVKVYAANCDLPSVGVKSLGIKDIYQSLISTKAVVNLSRSPSNSAKRNKYLDFSNLAAVLLLFYVLVNNGTTFLHQKRRFAELAAQKTALLDEFARKKASLNNISNAQRDILVIKAAVSRHNTFNADLRKLYQVIQKIGRIRTASYENDGQKLIIRQLNLETKKAMHHKQREHISHFIKRSIGTNLTVTWTSARHIQIVGKRT